MTRHGKKKKKKEKKSLLVVSFDAYPPTPPTKRTERRKQGGIANKVKIHQSRKEGGGGYSYHTRGKRKNIHGKLIQV